MSPNLDQNSSTLATSIDPKRRPVKALEGPAVHNGTLGGCVYTRHPSSLQERILRIHSVLAVNWAKAHTAQPTPELDRKTWEVRFVSGLFCCKVEVSGS